MNILITTSTFPVHESDGQARFVLDLALALSENSDVTVLAPHAVGAPRQERVGTVEVRRFQYFLPSSLQRLAYGAGMRHNLESSWLARIQVPFFFLAQLIATVRAVRKRRVSVINAHWLVPQGLTAAWASRLLGIPFVLHVHAADVYLLRRLRFGSHIARYVVRRSTSVFAAGSHVRESLDELIGFASNATLRPMGVHINCLAESASGDEVAYALPRQYVAFVGRLVEKKGLEFLIRAMPEVRRNHPDLELVVVGSGPLEQELWELTTDLGLQGTVHLLGYRSHCDAMAVMREAEVVCVPSIIDSRGETEGMPTVVLEAMAAGARVVGSDVDGIPDVLKDAENGWLVTPADSDALARGIEAALTDPAGDEVAVAGAATAGQHDWTTVGVEYGAVLAEATHG